MKKKEFGLDKSRLIDQTSFVEEVICDICKNILLEPISCSECQHIFCSSCINHWMERKQQNICIYRCDFSKKQVPPVMIQLLRKLKLKCKYSENGCQEQIDYDFLAEHEKNCEYHKKKCHGCKEKILKKDYESHVCQCEMISIVCGDCGNEMTRKDFQLHNFTLCLEARTRNNNILINELKEEIKSLSKKIKKLAHLREEDKKTILQLEKTVEKLSQNKELEKDLTQPKFSSYERKYK